LQADQRSPTPANKLTVPVALIACMRKLLTMLNAMAKSNKPWDPTMGAA
jgi:hypothetical protein